MSEIVTELMLAAAYIEYDKRLFAEPSPDDWRRIYAAMRAASVDTHAKRGDSTQIEAPSPMGSAVAESETPTRSRQSNKPGREM